MRSTGVILAVATAIGAVLIVLGLAGLATDAHQRVSASAITITPAASTHVDPKTMNAIRLSARMRTIVEGMRTGFATRPQHWTDFTADSVFQYSYSTDDTPTPQVAMTSPGPLLINPAALPVLAGLGVLLGGLFIAAARWRPRQNAKV